MDNQFDSESYWNRTTRKAFNFDEDVVDDATTAMSNVLGDDTISEASFNFESNVAAGTALSLSIKEVISDEAMKTILQEQTLDERIVAKGIAAEEELKLLRRYA